MITAQAADPVINYQGRLVESGVAVTATRTIQCSILSGTVAAWTGPSTSVTVTDGLYALPLTLTGITPAQLGAGNLKLRVKITNASNVLQTLTPDITLLPALSAYAVVDGGVTSAAIASNAITGAKILDGTITNSDLASSSVTGSKIATGTITSSDLAAGAATTAVIADNAVTGAKIVNGTITGSDLAAGAATTVVIADSAITSAKLADSAVTGAKIVDGTITGSDLASNSVTGSKIADGAVTITDLDSSLQATLSAINARLAKLEGQIVSADLAGTYRMIHFRTELGGSLNEDSLMASITKSTLTLAANGTGELVTTGEMGSTLTLTQKTVNSVKVPDFVRTTLDDAGESIPLTWSYSAGVLTLSLGLNFNVLPGGKMLTAGLHDQSDGANVLLIATKVP